MGYGPQDYGHWIILEGFKEDKLDLRVLKNTSYIGLAVSFRDIPDSIILNEKRKNMRLIKCSNHPEEKERVKIYTLDFSGRAHWFITEDDYSEYVSAAKDFSFVEDVDYEVFKNYQIGKAISMYGMSLIEIIMFWFKNNKLGKGK